MTFPILQFGTSRFLQAHVDLFVSQALANGEAIGRIVVVQTTSSLESRKRLAVFAAGDPYAVEIKGLVNGTVVDKQIEVTSIGGGVDANENWSEVERFFNQARCVISNTADRGYETHSDDGPDAQVPRSFPAKLAKLLLSRHHAGVGPITFFPCELVEANGDALRAAVLGVLDAWNVRAEAKRWIKDECIWVNSLVDRIVSQALKPAGAVAEPYALWAIENQPRLELPCRHADIVVTNDLKRYERLKLFILNLGHSFIAEGWAKRHDDPVLTVREAMVDEAVRDDLNTLYDKEVLPVFAAIGLGEEAHAYRNMVIDRFRNPFLDHRLADIFINHTAKKRRRFGGLIELAEVSGLHISQRRLRAALA